MKNVKYNNLSLENIEKICKILAKKMPENTVIFLYGCLGTGKTTFTKILGKTLKLNKGITSPSFSICNTYKSPDKKTFSHIDLYRIKDSITLEDLEIVKQGLESDICVIEWPIRKIIKLASKNACIKIYFKMTPLSDNRVVKFKFQSKYFSKELIKKLKALK